MKLDVFVGRWNSAPCSKVDNSVGDSDARGIRRERWMGRPCSIMCFARIGPECLEYIYRIDRIFRYSRVGRSVKSKEVSCCRRRRRSCSSVPLCGIPKGTAGTYNRICEKCDGRIAPHGLRYGKCVFGSSYFTREEPKRARAHIYYYLWLIYSFTRCPSSRCSRETKINIEWIKYSIYFLFALFFRALLVRKNCHLFF